MTKWKTIEQISYITLLFLGIIPLLSIIAFYFTKDVFFLYTFFASGVVGIILSYKHEMMLNHYEGE